jgi:hypothetical protein
VTTFHVSLHRPMHCSFSTTKTATAASHSSFLPPCYCASRVAPHAPRGACVVTRASLYDLLGVASSASTAEIRTAFRRLAARYHPDQNSSLLAHEKFQVGCTYTTFFSVCVSISLSCWMRMTPFVLSYGRPSTWQLRC